MDGRKSSENCFWGNRGGESSSSKNNFGRIGGGGSSSNSSSKEGLEGEDCHHLKIVLEELEAGSLQHHTDSGKEFSCSQ